jgi:hypothetical protein
MIKLKDLISLAGIELGIFKIHCATGKDCSPLEAFYDGKFKEWQECQNQLNFQCDKIISLIHLGGDRWLFAGVYSVEGVKARSKGEPNIFCPEGVPRSWFEYSTRELGGLEHLTGRTIVRFEKKFRASYLKAKKYLDSLIVCEIRDQRMSINDFPGYHSVLLPFRLLCTIVREDLPSWKSALSNVAGIYIITDNKTGKHYIGSAYGGQGLWQRWVEYAKDGHGNNRELIQIIDTNGKEYVKHFQLAILEICDPNTNNEYIISREPHWKDVLRSREFGYNTN